MKTKIITLLTLLILLFPAFLIAEKSLNQPGQVQLTLTDYNTLVRSSQNPRKDPRPVPSGYAVGQANVSVQVFEQESRASAEVVATFTVQILENEWTSVPLLPPGTAVQQASVNGRPIELISQAEGLMWGVNKSGSFPVTLTYSVDAISSNNGYILPLPLPQASGVKLSAQIPGEALDAAVIPAAGVRLTSSNNRTSLTATIPGYNGVQISWRPPAAQDQVISRAHYTGTLIEDAVHWQASFELELFHEETYEMKLFPAGITLQEVSVNDSPSPIIAHSDGFHTIVKGRGKHTVTALFEAPVQRNSGPPQIRMNIPAIPVSRFELVLPGKKELVTLPISSVHHTTEEQSTRAVTHIPLSNEVTFTWSEAVPDEIKTELRTNATIYHLIHAEEGVLYANGIVDLEVTAGATNHVLLSVPKDVQVNKITAEGGAITDWRIVDSESSEVSELEIFLDRKVRDNLKLFLNYDRSIVEQNESLKTPLLAVKGANRQRGMIALLSSKEIALRPTQEQKLTRVGENQLPAFIRNDIKHTVAHTFKYVQRNPELNVQPTTPEKKRGKFDAVINTLISLSDVTMKGAATIEINIKSGAIEELELLVPSDVNFLGLSAPSLRTHKVHQDGEHQIVRVEFTQEMEGQFRLEASYERIIADGQSESPVPTLKVSGAEVEQGKLAIEALAAVEVQAAAVKQLSTVDAAELPQQLILKTTNPILLAYKYVHADPPHELKLKITRHKEIDVQSAAIDLAHYRTLYTRDGISVTTATFTVRNSRKQFLRIKLPKGSQVWATTVDGKPEKPAVAENAANGQEVLIKVINSTQGFPVQLVYQAPTSSIGFLGTLSGALPTPDMVVTRSRWDVYLPDEMTYGRPDTNMQVLSESQHVTRKMMQNEVGSAHRSSSAAPDLLHIEVPASGIRYSFEKLYANQSDVNAYITIPYASGAGASAAQSLIIVATLLFWLGFIALGTGKQSSLPRLPIPQHMALACLFIGAVLLALTTGYFGANPELAAYSSAGVLILYVAFFIQQRRQMNS